MAGGCTRFYVAAPGSQPYPGPAFVHWSSRQTGCLDCTTMGKKKAAPKSSLLTNRNQRLVFNALTQGLAWAEVDVVASWDVDRLAGRWVGAFASITLAGTKRTEAWDGDLLASIEFNSDDAFTRLCIEDC